MTMSTTLAGQMLAACCLDASAQLGNGGTTYSSVEKTADSAESLIDKFEQATRDALTADAGLLGAVGLAAEAEQASTGLKLLAPDATPSMFESMVKLNNESCAALAQRLRAQPALDDAGRARFGGGVVGLAQAVQAYSSLAQDLPGLKQNLRTAGGAKSRVALYIAKTLPGSLGEMKQTLKGALEFARQNNIVLPAEVGALSATL